VVADSVALARDELPLDVGDVHEDGVSKVGLCAVLER
jgi:hypothetical protein